MAGILYYLIVPYAGKSKYLFIILFFVLTVIVTYVAFNVTRSSSDANVTSQFHGLFAGIVIITGVVNALLIPYMARNKNMII